MWAANYSKTAYLGIHTRIGSPMQNDIVLFLVICNQSMCPIPFTKLEWVSCSRKCIPTTKNFTTCSRFEFHLRVLIYYYINSRNTERIRININLCNAISYHLFYSKCITRDFQVCIQTYSSTSPSTQWCIIHLSMLDTCVHYWKPN